MDLVLTSPGRLQPGEEFSYFAGNRVLGPFLARTISVAPASVQVSVFDDPHVRDFRPDAPIQVQVAPFPVHGPTA